jgi:hypothetical protein
MPKHSRNRPILCLLCGLMITLAGSCSDDPAPPVEIETDATRDLDAAWKAADSWYPLFDFKGINWESVYDRYRPRAERVNGLDIDTLLLDLLAELKDAHAYFIHPLLGAEYPWVPPRIGRDVNAFAINVVERYFSEALRLAGHGHVQYGITPENVGYIHVSRFSDSGMMIDFNDVMEYVRNTTGLVVDLRGNLGGNADNNNYIFISRFTETAMDSYEAFTVTGPVDLPPYYSDGNSFRYTNPVIVLINGAVASAPETVAEMMKRIPNVTLMGDTTAGAGCWTLTGLNTVSLPSGRSVYIPSAYMVRLDGEPLEWNGIPPDIRVEQTHMDIISLVDKQLAAAIDSLK